MSLKLSVLDQCPIHNGKTASEALHDTLALAQLCDEAGYHRYWIAEHHDTPSYASSCPEVLIGQVAARTRQIRVGSGGVMLNHYSPYKVAEVFRTLNAYYPDRIDLGFGRAPGGAENSSQALAWPRGPLSADYYEESVSLLQGFLRDRVEGVRAMPYAGAAPGLWTLGSSAGSVGLAAHLGLGFVLALFIGTHERPAEIIQAYRQQFQPAAPGEQPQAIIATAVICADTEEEARLLAASHVYWKVLAFRHGIREGLLPPEEALKQIKKRPAADQAYFQETLDTIVTGTPVQCREQLQQTADFYAVDELMCVNVLWDFAARKRSYALLAQAFAD
ncbi:MAG: LLM class flavin-dependent oxidoreductase [Gammaproteobacteria bacterium]|nr:LLM class flavin-dependent oxidoreductase [Gammaproteobacteria bacterium]